MNFEHVIGTIQGKKHLSHFIDERRRPKPEQKRNNWYSLVIVVVVVIIVVAVAGVIMIIPYFLKRPILIQKIKKSVNQKKMKET